LLRVAFRAALTVLAAWAPLLCDDIDPAALLNRARAKIVGNIGRLPKYTCLQTVHRSRYERFPRMRVTGCGHVEDAGAAAESEPMLAWADRLKLDVTVSGGTEIFSWAGAHHFETENVEKIVGSGLTGTGDFGSFLMNTFGTNGPKYEYLGVALQTGGRQLAVYRYQVPLEASGPVPASEWTKPNMRVWPRCSRRSLRYAAACPRPSSRLPRPRSGGC